MKTVFFSIGLAASTLTVRAQVPMVAGMGLARAIVHDAQQAKATEVVTKVRYDGKTFPQRRTPADKLPEPGSTTVQEMEALLSQCYATCRRDNVTEIISAEQFRRFGELRRQVQAIPVYWTPRYYDEEMAFYQQQDHLRRARREERARQAPPADSLAPGQR